MPVRYSRLSGKGHGVVLGVEAGGPVLALPPLTPVIVSGSPSGSLSLASSVEAGILSAVFWVVAKPLSATATGGLSVAGFTVRETTHWRCRRGHRRLHR